MDAMQFSRLLYLVLLGREALSRLNKAETVETEYVATTFTPLGNNSQPIETNTQTGAFDSVYYKLMSNHTDSEYAIDQNHQMITQHFQEHGYKADSIELLQELLGELKDHDIRNLKKTKVGRSLAQSPLTGLDFTDAQVATAINMQNILRRKIAVKFNIPNMKEIRLNRKLQEAEEEFVKLSGAIKWLYLDSPVRPPSWKNHNLNFEYMSNNETFRAIAAKYPDLLMDVDQSNLLNMHDTSSIKSGTTVDKKLRGALLVLVLRYTMQYDCFVLSKCNPTQYDGFTNCFLPIQSCTRGNGWQYLVSAVYPHNDGGTFVFMAAPGRFAPEHNHRQRGANGYSFLFTHAMPKTEHGNSTWPPLTGSPFTKFGTPGSQCPASHPVNSNGLCSIAQVNVNEGRRLRSNI